MKNPFDRGGGSGSSGGGSKPPSNPFDRSPSTSKPISEKKSSPISMANPFGAKRVSSQTPLQRLKEINERRKAGLLKAVPAKKMAAMQSSDNMPPTRAAEAPAAAGPEKRVAAGFEEGQKRVPAAAQAQPQTQVVSALAGSGSMGGGKVKLTSARPPDAPADDSNSPFNRDRKPAPPPTESSTGLSVISHNSLIDERYRGQIEDPSAAQPQTQNAQMTPTQQMTGDNYTQMYQQQQLGIDPNATPMTGANYMEVYRKQQMGIDGVEKITGENYKEVYKKTEEIKREQEKAVRETVKQQQVATAETRKMEQANASFAHQAQGLQTKITLLRQQLGQGPDVDRGIYAAISELEGQLAQIPVGLR